MVEEFIKGASIDIQGATKTGNAMLIGEKFRSF